MEADHRISPAAGGVKAKDKFTVYQNPSFSHALASRSLRPSPSTLLVLVLSPLASSFSLLALSSREGQLAKVLTHTRISLATAQFVVRLVEAALGLIVLFTLPAFFRALLQYNGRRVPSVGAASDKKAKEEKVVLSERQLGLLGFKLIGAGRGGEGEQIKKPPKAKPATPSEPLVPIRKSSFSYTPSRPSGQSRIGASHLSPSGEKFSAASPISPSTPLQKSILSPSTPWSRKSSGGAKGIQTEAMLEQFLAGVDENIDKMTESSSKTATPPATIRAFGIASPISVATPTTPSGAARSTPLRPVRMSPGSHQKYITPPKKGEGELPLPMSLERAVEAFESLGIHPQIEQWRDHLRQWFSSVLMNPLFQKIKTSHIQVKQAAANVGVSITVSQVGSDLPSMAAPASLSPVGGIKDWQPTVTVDEDGILNHLRAALLRARDGSVAQQPFGSPQQPQQNPLLPAIQACIDAITEHRRLNTLMKGELIKGLLPQSSVRADYTVKRVQELAEGTCLKNYDYIGIGDGCGKSEKKWTSELPTDSHLLLYLFAAFLEHPKWMLHVDPTSYSGAQSSKNPLFLGVLPPKERFPEKYVALISGVPAVIHPGACILAVSKQSPPIFALYWDKKLQISLQGRTALWDAILLLCHQINVGYGGVVRGIHLGSSALNILPVLSSDMES